MKLVLFVTFLFGLIALISGLPHRDVGFPGRQAPTVVIVKQPIIPIRPQPKIVVVNPRSQVIPARVLDHRYY